MAEKGIITEVKDTAIEGAKAAKGLAGEIINKELEVMERLAAVLEDRESEVRLKFDNLTLNGDIALTASILKKRDK